MSRSTIVKLSALTLAAILLVLGGAGSVSVHANPLQATDTAAATMSATTAATMASTTLATMASTPAAPAGPTMAATASCPPVGTAASAVPATMAATMVSTAVPTAAGTQAAFTPGFLGVAVSTAPDGCGSIVEEVVTGQAADKAGIKVNDEIIGADGSALTTSDALRTYVIAHQPGDTLNLSVLRGTSTSVIAVTLGTRPADALATVAATMAATANTSAASATMAATMPATTDTSAASATMAATMAATN